jgi:hypothetical protein
MDPKIGLDLAHTTAPNHDLVHNLLCVGLRSGRVGCSWFGRLRA